MPPQIALDIFNDIAKMIDDAVVTVYVEINRFAITKKIHCLSCRSEP